MEYNAITLYKTDFKCIDTWKHILDNAQVPQNKKRKEKITMVQFTIGKHLIWE